MIASVLLGLILFVVPVWSASPELPFQNHGMIDDVFLAQHQVIIFDHTYALPPLTLVYVFNPAHQDPETARRDSRHQSQQALRKGMYIGFNVQAAGRRDVITEVWLLSPDMQRSLRRQRE
jgi:hypothetical protein